MGRRIIVQPDNLAELVHRRELAGDDVIIRFAVHFDLHRVTDARFEHLRNLRGHHDLIGILRQAALLAGIFAHLRVKALLTGQHHRHIAGCKLIFIHQLGHNLCRHIMFRKHVFDLFHLFLIFLIGEIARKQNTVHLLRCKIDIRAVVTEQIKQAVALQRIRAGRKDHCQTQAECQHHSNDTELLWTAQHIIDRKIARRTERRFADAHAALFAEALAGLTAAHCVDRGHFPDARRAGITEQHDDCNDCKCTEQRSQNAVTAAEHHRIGCAFQQQPFKRDRKPEADQCADDRNAEILDNVQQADSAAAETDRLHHADLAEFLCQREADRKAQNNKRNQNQANADDHQHRCNDHTHHIGGSDRRNRRIKQDALRLAEHTLDSRCVI